jgi:hypothetical protein
VSAAVDIEGAESIPANQPVYNETASELINLFVELRAASVAKGWKHFQISLDNPIYAGQPLLTPAYDLAGLAEHIDFFVPMGYDMNGMGTVVRHEGRCAGDGAYCYFPPIGPKHCITDNSTCVNHGGCEGYGGDGSTADANSPLPGLRMAMKQYIGLGVKMDQIVLGLPWCE